MHSTIERPQVVTRRRWIGSPASHVAVVVALLVGFFVWGVLVDGQSVMRGVGAGVGVAALYVLLAVVGPWILRQRR